MANKQPLRQGEKILFGIVGVFFVLAVVGYGVLEVVRMNSDQPMFAVRTHYDFTPEGQKGSVIFRKSQCTDCHRAMRNGTNMGLSLDGVGSKRTLEWLEKFLAHPEETYPTATVDHGFAPKEASYVADMSKEDRHAMAVFLSELTADQGSASSPLPPKGDSSFIDSMVKMWAPKEWHKKYEDVRDEEGGAALSGNAESKSQ